MKRNGCPPFGRVKWSGIFDGEALERIKSELLSK